jgi:hypothetical protein
MKYDDEMTEAEFIASEQEKLDAKLAIALRKIDRTGGFKTSTAKLDLLWSNQLIEVTRPNDRIPYNHHQLTAQAREFLAARR